MKKSIKNSLSILEKIQLKMSKVYFIFENVTLTYEIV